MRLLGRRREFVVVPGNQPRTRAQLQLINALALVYAFIWLSLVLLIVVGLRWDWPLKIVALLVLFAFVPSLEGPWRYAKYLEWWEEQHRRAADALRASEGGAAKLAEHNGNADATQGPE